MKKTKLDKAAAWARNWSFAKVKGGAEIARGYRTFDGKNWKSPTPEEEQSIFPIAQHASEVAFETTLKANPSPTRKAEIAKKWKLDFPQAKRVLAMAEGLEAGQRAAMELLGLETWPVREPDPVDTAFMTLSSEEGWEEAWKRAVAPSSPKKLCEECEQPFLPRQKNQRFCSVACGKKQRSRLAKRRERARPKILDTNTPKSS